MTDVKMHTKVFKRNVRKRDDLNCLPSINNSM